MLRFFVIHNKVQTQFDHGGGPIVFGRGPTGREPAPSQVRRVLTDLSVSRDHLGVEELPGLRVRLRNLSERFPIKLASGVSLAPGDATEADLPVRLTLGSTLLQIEPGRDDAGRDTLRTLEPPLRPGVPTGAAVLPDGCEGIAAERLARWFEAVIAIQNASASSDAFYRQSARAVVELIGLDRGLVLLRRGGDWEVIARHETADAHAEGREFSRGVLDRVCRERRSFFSAGPTDDGARASLQGVDAVVAAPILADAAGDVVGFVYGARLRHDDTAGAAIRPLEAQLVQVLAAAVGAGLARAQSEADAARRRVQFEQFFSAELARELDRDPRLLEGREREITILFSDLRGFSRLSEHLSPREVCQLAGDVMDRLTERVRAHGGTVVSYSGDGMMALWNAPADQPDHAILGCRAALAMHAELPGLNALWEGRIGRPLGLGIGLNTGRALVGNTGSRSKFMYGPSGHAVNLASRVEGATKQLGVPILITDTTHAQLHGAFATRRLSRVRVVGIDGTVELHELHGEGADPAWLSRRDTYEQGLSHYESGRWAQACRTLYPLLADSEPPYDQPTLSLVGRCLDCLQKPERPFNPVVELDHK